MSKDQLGIKQASIGSPAWVAEIKRGNSKLVADLYRQYKKDFVNWIQYKTNCNDDFAVDIFQDSVVALYENIKKGKIVTFDQSVKQYLFGIGKKVYYLHLRKHKQKRVQTISLEENKVELGKLNIETPLSNLDEKSPLLKLLLKMKEPCKSILYLFYYKELKTKEVAESLKYKSEGVVRVQKARCMTALRKAYSKQNK